MQKITHFPTKKNAHANMAAWVSNTIKSSFMRRAIWNQFCFILPETLTRELSLMDPLISNILRQYKSYFSQLQFSSSTWLLLLQIARPMLHYHSQAWTLSSPRKSPIPATQIVASQQILFNVLTCASSMQTTGRVPWGERLVSKRTSFT